MLPRRRLAVRGCRPHRDWVASFDHPARGCASLDAPMSAGPSQGIGSSGARGGLCARRSDRGDQTFSGIMRAMSIPVFITCRDRVACLQRLVDRLETMDGVGPIVLVDNDSAWPPLLDYLDATPHEVVRLAENSGHLAVWRHAIHEARRRAGPFVVTDPDVIPRRSARAFVLTGPLLADSSEKIAFV